MLSVYVTTWPGLVRVGWTVSVRLMRAMYAAAVATLGCTSSHSGRAFVMEMVLVSVPGAFRATGVVKTNCPLSPEASEPMSQVSVVPSGRVSLIRTPEASASPTLL